MSRYRTSLLVYGQLAAAALAVLTLSLLPSVRLSLVARIVAYLYLAVVLGLLLALLVLP